MTQAQDPWIEGYHAPIKRGVWERPSAYGVPRIWAAIWACLCLYAGLVVLTRVGFLWVLVPAVGWVVGHGVLMGLTLFDAHWDDMALAQLQRRYKKYYDAG